MEQPAASGRMPTIYLSHGAPPLADDPLWPGQLAAWSAALPRPQAVLMVSAHWEEAPIAVGATTTVPLVYDFWGFPQRYYEVTYPAPGAPALADEVRRLLGTSCPGGPSGPAVQEVADRGLDHGAYVPLAAMYPDADVPVLQLSIPTLDPRALMDLGRRLAPLRDQGVLIVGSGFFTHNLQVIRSMDGPGDTRPGAPELAEFDDWGRHALDAGDVDALLDFQHKAPAARVAHPRTEHWVPLFVVLGAGEPDLDDQRSVIDGFWFANAKRSIQIG
jgi:4,5-DOPA dioxygenase extradiol